MSTKRADLDQLAVVVNNSLGTRTIGDGYGYYVQGANGRVRLVRDRGSVEVSPSLTKPELELWIRAFLEGIWAGQGRGE